MGMSKASLDYMGTPLWLFQMKKLIRLRPGQIFFSVPLDMEFPPGSWTVVHDRFQDIGPLGGLEAALRLTRENFLITLAVDMPAMTVEFLSFLLDKHLIREALQSGIMKTVEIVQGESALFENWNSPEDVKRARNPLLYRG